MPAATSLEDIYHHSLSAGHSNASASCGSSLSSSYSPSSSDYFHPADYYTTITSSSPSTSNTTNIHHLHNHQSTFQSPKLTVAKQLSADSCNINNNNSNNNRQQLGSIRRQQQHHNFKLSHKHPLNLSATAVLAVNNAKSRHQRSRAESTYQYQLENNSKMASERTCLPAEPLLFLYNDDELSTSSAPDCFPSLQQQSTGQQQQPDQAAGNFNHHLTIEELRLALNSCWLCGCNWQQDHVSLDCQECGGYALTRPCPNCDGRCQQVWRRNINGSHDYQRALWVGECKLDGLQAECCVAATSTSRLAREACLLRNLELRSDDDDEESEEEEDEEDDYCRHFEAEEEEDENNDEDDDDDCGIQVAIGSSSVHCDDK